MPMGHNAVSDPGILDRVVKLAKEGKKDVEIAKILGLTKNTVQRCRVKRGLRRQRNARTY